MRILSDTARTVLNEVNLNDKIKLALSLDDPYLGEQSYNMKKVELKKEAINFVTASLYRELVLPLFVSTFLT